MNRGRSRRVAWGRVVLAGVIAAGGSYGALTLRAANEHRSAPPPSGGYFLLQPVGSYARLPDDAAAAAMVHYSTWEPRPGNTEYNDVMPVRLVLQPVSNASGADDPRWNKYILDRITGHFTGTTDEIFQWAAAKWGLPDNLLRTIAYLESNWRQSNYGDYVNDRAQCPAGYQELPCPVTFGIVGAKSTSWPGIFPWNRDSTAAAVDVLGGGSEAATRDGCGGSVSTENRSHGAYQAGNIWGCVGAWYSGNWFDGSAANPHSGEGYIHLAQYWEQRQPWLQPGFRSDGSLGA